MERFGEPDWAALFAGIAEDNEGFLRYLTRWAGCLETVCLSLGTSTPPLAPGEAIACGPDLFLCASTIRSKSRLLQFRYRDAAKALALEAWLKESCASRVKPLLLQACELFFTVQEEQALKRAALSFLDRLPLPLMVFDAACRPAFANRAAVRLSQTGDDLGLSSAAVHLRRERENLQLQKLLKDMATRELIRLQYRDQLFMMTLGGRQVPALLTTNRWLGAGESPAMSEFLVWMYVLPAEDSQGLDTTALRLDHGLTVAEAELASHLFGGRCVKSFARDRGVSEATARTQLRSLLKKSRTESQEALMVKLFHARLDALNAWPGLGAGVREASPWRVEEGGCVTTSRD